MMYCDKHCCFYYEKKCPKCVDDEPPHLRDRTEVADPTAWNFYKKNGWTK